MHRRTLPARVESTAETVSSLLSTSRPTRSERRRATRLDRILGHEPAREVLMGLTDQVLRIHDSRHSITRLRQVVSTDLEGFGAIDRLGLGAASFFGRVAAPIVKRAVDWRIVAETRGVIFDASEPTEVPGFERNLNVLGEAILGDDEAAARVAEIVARLDDHGPMGSDYVSVKISALCANLDVLAFDLSVARIAERLRVLYRAALRRTPVGFVNLDMEEYRDLALTIAAFTRVLDEPEFLGLEAGIVLQAYLPDSHPALLHLGEWSAQRRNRDGAGIKVRLVKGANLAMERVESEMHHWEQAPYATKVEVDANLKRLVELALDPAWRGAVRIGLGSHNLFDIAWAATLAEHTGQSDRLEFEMLAGMAPAQARAVREQLGTVRLYLPVAHRDALDAGISYLARRLDENAAPENFLRNLLRIAPGNEAFAAEEQRFQDALRLKDSVSSGPRRSQQRGGPTPAPRSGAFTNASDTDFTLPENRRWIEEHIAQRPHVDVAEVDSIDGVDSMVATGLAAAPAPLPTRIEWLHALGDVMETERGVTLSLMAYDTGKTVREGDPEVSEAIDAARFAATVGATTLTSLEHDGLQYEPLGVVVVAAPWNFPYAIPTLSIASALVAGNRVIVKPSPHARAIGAHLVEQCHRAGVPPHMVQLAACADGPVSTRLVTHPNVGLVVLTGSTATAQRLLATAPRMRLVAETSGKNTMVVTEAADVDAAIRDVVKAAFGHAGQKCSATSVVVFVGDLGTRADVLDRLADATRSVRVGQATDLATMTGPLIGTPNERLQRAFDTLDEGEKWLVRPQLLDSAANLWSPGIRIGVKEGSWFHTTECFGPVLGVMTAPDLETALRLQNATSFGLTGGLHSLDPDEIDYWLRHVEVGNAYVNRHMTGAIVQRQPFGGWKGSSVGGGSKPGGPDHVLSFVRFTNAIDDASADATFGSAFESLYGVDTDPCALVAEHNVLRHHPLGGVVVQLPEGAELPASLSRAAAMTGTPYLVSHDDDHTVDLMHTHRPERVRLLTEVSDRVLTAAHELGIAVDRTLVTNHGRVELGRWLKEQAISLTAHRHGRIDTAAAAPLRSSRQSRLGVR